jgi:hypothetical protein
MAANSVEIPADVLARRRGTRLRRAVRRGERVARRCSGRHDEGDAAHARDCWERSATHAARAGLVPGVLAQQPLLAQLARERGDEAGATAIAEEVRRWAAAIGATRLCDQATAFVEA